VLAADDAINLVRIIGGITCIGILCIALIGTEWESKAQVVLLFILLAAMLNFIFGTFLPVPEAKYGKGFLGFSTSMIAENFGPQFTPDGGKDYGFFEVFAVFFPAATGILAGANISGDLANPSTAIPKGTFMGIIVTSLSYIMFAFLVGATTLRYATGIAPANASDLSFNELRDFIGRAGPCDTASCPFGLFNDANVMEMVSVFGPLVNAGVFAATLSSALASLVSAPKVFQALCKDKLFPHIDAFGKGYGPNGEPKRGYFLAMGIGIGCVAIGKLNSIAPLISNFFMAAYCLINFACFHASFARSPGFRPAFKYYNMWLSLLGAILCLGVMFVMEPYTALITFAVILGLHMYIGQRKPDVNWGSSTQAQTYKDALNAVYKLQQVEDHVKNYRPQILVLSGEPNHRPPLIDFAYSITKKLSLLICGHVARPPLSHRARYNLTVRAQQWLQRRKVKSFYSIVVEDDRSKGVRSLLQCAGVGKLRPNVVMLGYKYQWGTCHDEELEEYFNIIHEILDHHMSIAILRLPEGLDYSDYANTDALVSSPTINGKSSNHLKLPGTGGGIGALERNESTLFPRNVSSAQLSTGGSSREGTPPATPQPERRGMAASMAGAIDKDKERGSCKERGDSKERQDDEEEALVGSSNVVECPKEVLQNVNQFLRKQRKGTIDVWWLYDDGGLTMLVPYLLSTRSNWSSCKLRVFSLANKKEELDREQRNMAALLSKFRMEYSDVIVIPDVQKPPSEETRREFEKLIARWRTDQDELSEDNKLAITDSELLALKAKTNRHLRLREFLLQYSRDSNLVVMTLPMPRKNTCSASLYMAWLDMLTRDMPPFLLIRGNQTSVLTFYS
ncbi:solute carrier family 12 member 2-like, partial [Tropilaelaps mercedesae]